MGRPTKFDRQEALTTAINAIWKNGFEKSSVSQLADLLGITRSSFYNTFGSQEALFLEALPEYAANSPDAPLADEVTGPVLPLISSVFREICRVRAADPDVRGCLIINSVCEFCPDSKGLGAKLAEIVLGSVERIEELLAIACEGGEIPASSNIHALALALQNLMIGLNVICKVINSEKELWLLTRTTLEGLGLYRGSVDT